MKILGHHVHPIVIVFPLGLLATAVIFDVLHMVSGGKVFAVVSYWMIVSGLIGGVLAAIFGLLDWVKIPVNTRARSIGLTQGVVNVGVLVLFCLSWYMRRENVENPNLPSSIVSFAGAAVALVGGWLGGELVERLGVGVHTGANVNAPSSLLVDLPETDAKENRVAS